MDNRQKLSIIQALHKMNTFGNIFAIKICAHLRFDDKIWYNTLVLNNK